MSTVGAKTILNLDRQFPGWSQDQRSDETLSSPLLLVEPLENWNRECSRLAGTSLGKSQEISTVDGFWYRSRLNLGGGGISLLRDGSSDLQIDSER